MSLLFGVNIGFLEVTLLDVLDIVIVGYLIYQVYKLLKGSIAANIFVGIILLFAASWVVEFLDMELLSSILGKLVSVGVLMLLIVFQPEVRRFLILLGKGTLSGRLKFVEKLFGSKKSGVDEEVMRISREIISASYVLGESFTGALIVLTGVSLERYESTGTRIDGELSASLLKTIFNKTSPLHDGAVIVMDGKIKAASCILPVSQSQSIPASAGLRHRSAVGVTEESNSLSIIVSEETGKVSVADGGVLKINLSKKQLEKEITLYLSRV